MDEYTTTYEPDDQLEWSLVLGEIKSFLEADAILNILDADSNPMVISHRYNNVHHWQYQNHYYLPTGWAH